MKNIVQKSTETLKTTFKVKHALMGLDFEETDSHILRYFDFFRKTLPVQAAHFSHVLPTINMWNSRYEKEIAEIMNQEEWKKEVTQRIEKQVRSSIQDNGKFQFRSSGRKSPGTIVKKANDLQADLLVVGKGKRKDYDPVLAKNLIRKAEANILIIPQASKTQLNTILVPVDFSKYSRRALEIAIQIKQQLNYPISIIALHVYSMPIVTTYRTDQGNINFEDIVKADILDAFTSFLQTFDQGEELVKMALSCRKGPGIANYIMEFAEEINADLMILGAKGHSNVHLLLMGSVTEKLISMNHYCPSLIIK